MKNEMMRKAAHMLAGIALFMTTMNLSETCLLWLHQPEMPEKVKEMRKHAR